MSQRNGATRLQLAFEQGNDRTVRAQHIAESHRGKHSLGNLGIVLHDHFAHALGGTHDICRINRFVGRDENEVGTTALMSHAHYIQRAEHIVLDGLTRIRLHKGHMLVCCSVKNNMRIVAIENLF